MAIASIGVKLGYSITIPATTYTNAEGLLSVPELGGDPEMIDVTTLADTVKHSVPGVQDPGDLQFTFIYDKDEYKKMYDLQGKKVAWEVEFPDGVKFDFQAIPNVKVSGAEVNSAVTFTISMALQTDIVPVFPEEG